MYLWGFVGGGGVFVVCSFDFFVGRDEVSTILHFQMYVDIYIVNFAPVFHHDLLLGNVFRIPPKSYWLLSSAIAQTAY